MPTSWKNWPRRGRCICGLPDHGGFIMYVVCVTAQIKPDKVNEFRTAILDKAANTRKDPGNIRFDVLQGEDDPTRFTLYEVYKTKDDFAKHQQTPHYLKWKNA